MEKIEKKILFQDFQKSNYLNWENSTNLLFNDKLDDYVKKIYEDIAYKPIYFKEYINNNYLNRQHLITNLTNSINCLLSQDIPLPTPEDFNSSLSENLNSGQNAIALKLDDASAYGFNPDELIIDKIGKNGTSFFTSSDFDKALKNINIELYPIFIKTSTNITSIASVFFYYLLRNKIDIKKITGGFHYDPLSALAQKHEYPYDYELIFDEIVSIFNWLKFKKSPFSVITINGNLFNDTGGNAVQELAFTMSELVLYLKELLNHGINIDEAASRIKLSYAIGPNFFIEISKLRAARILWAKIIKHFGGNKESQRVWIHTETCKWNKFKTDAYVNILRNTGEALSAMLGGCNSINLQYFDKEFGLPNEFSGRITRNTFLVLKEECDFAGITDIPGGSWYVENITNGLAKNAWELFQKVEKEGGFYSALDNGFIKEEIEKVKNERLFNYTKKIDEFIGNNIYPNPKEKPIEATEIDYKQVFQQRHSTLKAHIEKRDNMNVSKLLDKFNASVSEDPLDAFEYALNAVQAGATLGEISKPYNVKFNATIKNPIEKMKLSE
ncbi:MAG: hypothetical protein EPN82_08440 [Bacteroidetes bacterium]|nr:MAG: hypothetical protein EPN82_08440 [Bacteroidota bacterium]